jgi:hypothetical protein
MRVNNLAGQFGTRRCLVALAAGSAALTFGVALSASPAAAKAAARPPAVLHVGQIGQQDVPALPGSEPDTLVEPDVAVSPLNSDIAVAVAHDGRYPDGGAVGIEYSWTHDGGASWHHQPLPGVTTTTGGRTWTRASDPVAAFAPDGAVYVSTLVFDAGCNSGVVVSKSSDGGRTFAAPTVAHRSSDCAISDDKNWLVVDAGAKSPHKGRLYQFWTPFLTDMFGNADGSPQAVVWSDNGGSTWSTPVNVSAPHANTQNSQPMVRANGTIVDAYIDYGPNSSAEGPEVGDLRAAVRGQAVPHHLVRPTAAATTYPVLTTRVSTDGGTTWKAGGTVTRDLGNGPPDFRCCLPSTTIDASTGRMYAAWNSIDATMVKLSSSTNGVTWTAPVVVNAPDPALLGVSADVSAWGGTVAVSYGLTNKNTTKGRFGRQFLATSRDGGTHFLTATAVGPQINYAYAAQAGGIFPGDYIGSAMSPSRLYAVWAVSSAPPVDGAAYHQVLYGAVLDTNGTPLRLGPVPQDARAAVMNR